MTAITDLQKRWALFLIEGKDIAVDVKELIDPEFFSKFIGLLLNNGFIALDTEGGGPLKDDFYKVLKNFEVRLTRDGNSVEPAGFETHRIYSFEHYNAMVDDLETALDDNKEVSEIPIPLKYIACP